MLTHKLSGSTVSRRSSSRASLTARTTLPILRHQLAPKAHKPLPVAMSISTSEDASTEAMLVESEDTILRNAVKHYYSTVLSTSSDLKTSACTACKLPSIELRALMASVPKEVLDKFYGCGNAIPLGIQGLRVLDLGCGSGRDCFLASALVGAKGNVIGLDMTPEQLEVGERNAVSYCQDVLHMPHSNMQFVLGQIEDLDKAGIESDSVDLIISNCVINLSPDKASVLAEAYRVLAPGGEMHFSDVYVDRRLPAALRTHDVLVGECLGGALYHNDFLRLCHTVGFLDPRLLESEEIIVEDRELALLCGEARFFSMTYRLFKIPTRLETLCEDYGQVAIYHGTYPGQPHGYELDNHHRLIANKPMLVCGNTASMLTETWLKPHFTVHGNRNTHFGEFPCGPAANTLGAIAPPARGAGNCC